LNAELSANGDFEHRDKTQHPCRPSPESSTLGHNRP
jgi:hypothetical protein